MLPPQLLFAHPGYVRAAHGIQVPGRHQLFLHGCDVSRNTAGSFVVNADWTQAPSGAGYALAGRRVIAHAASDMYERIAPRPASPWAQALRLALIDAAPESADEPMVVVLSPGTQSETAFDQAYLAGVLGFPLVESADLVVRDGRLWMRSLGTLKRVDVVLRRVDAGYVDPLDLRPDSRLGVVGLVEVMRRGAVTVVNTLGSGILESPGLLHFLPQLAEMLVGETPMLASPQTYWGGVDVERSHLLSHLSSLLVKPTTGGDTIVGPALTAAQRDELAARIAAEPWRWIGQEPPAILLGANGLPPRWRVRRGGRGAPVHRCAARWIRADERWPGLSAGAGQQCLHHGYRCGQGCLGAHPGPGQGGAQPGGGPAGHDAEPDPVDHLAACAVRPVLAGPVRRTRGADGASAHRHPRAVPRIPLPPGHGGEPVRAGAARRHRSAHRNRHRRRR